MFVLILILAAPDFVTNTGIYHELGPKYAVVTPDEWTFVLDRFEQNLWLHQPNQEPVRVARKGMGPGELDRANKIFWFDGHLYVECAIKFQIFDAQGKHLKELNRPPGSKHMFRMATGWIGFHWSLTRTQSTLTHYSEDLKEKTVIKKWDEPHRAGTKRGENGLLSINPSPDTSLFAGQTGAENFYYRLQEEDQVRVYNVVRKTHLPPIELNAKRYPFNVTWGEAQLDKFRGQLKGKTLRSDFPDFFPVVAALFFDVHGNLVYRKETGKKPLQYFSIQTNGDAQEYSYVQESYDRIVAFQNDTYYVSYQTDSDEFALAKVPRDEIEAFMAKHPTRE